MKQPCPVCGGVGTLPVVKDGKVVDQRETCWRCKGEGKIDPEEICDCLCLKEGGYP